MKTSLLNYRTAGPFEKFVECKMCAVSGTYFSTTKFLIVTRRVLFEFIMCEQCFMDYLDEGTRP